ncbi:hypothetical protein JZ751_000052 [Albula glossodonta]|uniref:Uncharacterized protein n=1 Tax=Albula glossodonta TaxID=121402 RepID=A0A8T2PV77_9TELE|nr:hypothetical protein JZ751_000052 [Albula glossodonta]
MSDGLVSSLNELGSASYLSSICHLWDEWVGLGNLEDFLSYLDYLVWVFTPLAIVFILPLIIILLLYLSILFLHVYKRKNELREAYSNNLWDGARKTLATLWDGHGNIWHGKPLTICSMGLGAVWGDPFSNSVNSRNVNEF